ncbi:MAG: BrnA antitoxin family protein [Candidatus Riflebacteria bacterium]|nr:BrnA antitoxin family protein [Candidatus Riflebacteria bacterium]
MKTNKRKLIMPTPEEDAAIRKGIDQDSDAKELNDDDFVQMRTAEEVSPEIVNAFRKGRGIQKAPKKEPVTLRLSREVLDFFKASGRGWQTRINNALLNLVHGSK